LAGEVELALDVRRSHPVPPALFDYDKFLRYTAFRHRRLLDAYGSLRDDYMDSEQHSEMFRQIGFHSWPETAEDFVRACIADRATGT
jgi:hypothetical protein